MAAAGAATLGCMASPLLLCDSSDTVDYEAWKHRVEILERQARVQSAASTTRTLHVYVTGFGPFGKVVDNPTSVLCKKLHSRRESFARHGIHFVGIDITEVSAEAADRKAASIIEAMRGQPGPACILHMGVAVGIPKLHLESRAVNLANFVIPDVRGWVAQNVEIVPGGPRHAFTALPLAELMCELRDAGVDCDVSSSAGSYICNYIYYASLTQASAVGVPVLFVHVPSFATVSEEQQAFAIEQLMLALHRLADKGRL